MKTLTTLVAGAFALMAANFATVAPAQADSFGFHVGRGGFGIHVSDYGYDDGYYGHNGYYDDGYYRHHRRCVTRWDFRHKWYCRRYHRSYYYDDYYPYYDNYYSYYPRHRFYRHHNRHWRHGNRHWRDGRRHRRHGRRHHRRHHDW